MDPLVIAICIQLFSKYYNLERENKTYHIKPLHFRIVIDLDNVEDLSILINQNPLLSHSQEIQECLGVASIDAMSLSLFVRDEQIIIGEDYYRKLNTETLRDIGLTSAENIKEKFKFQFLFD